MIQLANDPNTSRSGWRPVAGDDKSRAQDPRRRPGHAWPFLARPAERPQADSRKSTPHTDSGS